MEKFITGYCRCLDKSRIVLLEDGEADCEYEHCPHKENCPIAQEIKAAMEGFTQKVYAVFGKLYQQQAGAEGNPMENEGPQPGSTNADGSVNAEGGVE